MLRGAALLSALAVATACQTRKSDEQEPPPGPETTRAPVSEQWAQVLAWAKPTVEPADATLFVKAVGLAKDHTKAVRDAKQSAQRYAVERGALPPEVGEAVDALVAWADAGGGLPPRACDSAEVDRMSDALVAHEIARAALLTAPDDPDSSQVRAVLYLGQRFRREGKNVMEISVGVVLAGSAVEWARARGVAPGKLFRELAPSEDLVFHAVAAESACQVGLVEAGGRDDQTIGTQLASVREFNSETVHGAFRRKDDPHELEAYLLARGEQARQKTDTPILRTLSAANRMYAELRKEREAYVAFVTTGK